MFIPDLADAAHAWSVATRLRELREDEFVGGYVLRRFEHFHPGEVRTWWVDSTCRLISAHPDTPTMPPPARIDLTRIASTIAALGLRWVTVDLAQRTDGAWRIIELGDAQVSERPISTTPEALIATLNATTEWARPAPRLDCRIHREHSATSASLCVERRAEVVAYCGDWRVREVTVPKC
jgi:hypothetical protein